MYLLERFLSIASRIYGDYTIIWETLVVSDILSPGRGRKTFFGQGTWQPQQISTLACTDSKLFCHYYMPMLYGGSCLLLLDSCNHGPQKELTPNQHRKSVSTPKKKTVLWLKRFTLVPDISSISYDQAVSELKTTTTKHTIRT